MVAKRKGRKRNPKEERDYYGNRITRPVWAGKRMPFNKIEKGMWSIDAWTENNANFTIGQFRTKEEAERAFEWWGKYKNVSGGGIGQSNPASIKPRYIPGPVTEAKLKMIRSKRKVSRKNPVDGFNLKKLLPYLAMGAIAYYFLFRKRS